MAYQYQCDRVRDPMVQADLDTTIALLWIRRRTTDQIAQVVRRDISFVRRRLRAIPECVWTGLKRAVHEYGSIPPLEFLDEAGETLRLHREAPHAVA